MPITEQKTNLAVVLFPDFSVAMTAVATMQFDEPKARRPRADVTNAAPGLL